MTNADHHSTRATMLHIPEAFAATISAWHGEEGQAWLARLPGTAERLCAEWGLTPDGAVMHGAQGIVIPVSSADGQCVLKIAWQSVATKDEERALRAWNGRGAVRLLQSGQESGAMLLERLDPTDSLDNVPVTEAVEIASSLLRRLAIDPLPGLRTTQGIAQELAAELISRWEQVGRPMPRRMVERACRLAADLARTTAAHLVNNDLHYTDVLRGTREPWLAVDPMVVNGNLEFSIPQLLWWRLEDIEAQGGVGRHLHAIVETASLDAAVAQAWVYTRCIDYWLWGLAHGLTIDPARCERIVTILGDV
jgi:streptomycin 6-kinase